MQFKDDMKGFSEENPFLDNQGKFIHGELKNEKFHRVKNIKKSHSEINSKKFHSETNQISRQREEEVVEDDAYDRDDFYNYIAKANASIDLKKKEKEDEISEEAKREAGIKTAFVEALKKKEDIKKELQGETSYDGDVVALGKQGVVAIVYDFFDLKNKLKELVGELLVALIPYLVAAFSIVLVFLVIVAILIEAFASMEKVGNGIQGFLDQIVFDDSTYVDELFSEEEIAEIKKNLILTEEEEKAVTFALSKVGYPYSQAKRESGDYFDCSSLCYYALCYAGYDLSPTNHKPPTAAAMAKALVDSEKTIVCDDESFTMRPGDLIFYGGSNNGRYMGIYHVAMYIGGGYVVEALGDEYGVVYRAVKTKNACLVARVIERSVDNE